MKAHLSTSKAGIAAALIGTFQAVIAVALFSFITLAEAVVIGAPGTGPNRFPFSGPPVSPNPGTRYQQVYDEAAFGGPITIGQINFFLRTAGTLNSGTYTFSLSHSANPVNALDTTNFDNNVGADDTLFGVFALTGGAAPSILSFTGAPFVYDGIGDLLLDIDVAALTTTGSAFFEARPGDAGGVFSRAQNFGAGFENIGLVTEFLGPRVPGAGVPLPGTLALLTIGLAGLGFVRRRPAA